MKRLCYSAIFVLLLGSVFTQNKISGNQIFEKDLPRVGRRYVPGEIIVKFQANVTQDDINVLNSAHGVSAIYTSPSAGFSRLRIPSDKTVPEMVEIYHKNANVEYAEANYIAYAMMVPNDELFPLQWNLHSTEYGGIQMESAWDISDGTGVIVAVVDTGIAYENYSEEDSGGRIIYYEQASDLAGAHFVTGYDFVNRDEHANDDSSPGHGTHIAGTIAQNTNNNSGASGVAFNAFLMPVKVLDSKGAGTYADIAEGIIWATNNGARVINLGLGGDAPSKTLEYALAYAYNKGVTVIAAAGNGGIENVSYPAAYDDYVIAVGASRYDETLTYYSNYGPGLDLVAPGGDLNVDQNGDGYSDGVLQQTYEESDFSSIFWGYCLMEGTSMAAAHVSAVAALLIANEVAVTPAEVRAALESTAEDKGPTGWDTEYGWGMVDAYAALQWKAKTELPEPSQPLPLKAEFMAKPSSGAQPLTVQFVDESTGQITDWLWDFGDGTTSTQQNPLHTYDRLCHFTVTLTVTGPSGSNTRTREDYIIVFSPYAPAAEFKGDSTNGYSPLSVQFTDLSSCPATVAYCWEDGTYYTSMNVASLGGVTGWSWDFGDGKTSIEQNPVHTYQSPGTYSVRLTVTGPGGTSSKRKTNYIQVTIPPTPVADFVGIPTTGAGPLTVQFTDTSIGSIIGWSWNFGDGSTSNQQNPIHTYKLPGTYTISLTITGINGSNSKRKDNYIQVTTPPAPVAEFVGMPTTGDGPLTVQFTDKSIGSIVGWLWDFGDGSKSNQQNPLHTYINPGTYTVSLTITGVNGSSNKNKMNYILVTTPPKPLADFVGTPITGDGPLTVQFTDKSFGNITGWLWDFGDGATSTEQNPSHTYMYRNTGDFTVSLTVQNPGGSHTKTKTNYIHLNTPPVYVSIVMSKDRVFRTWYTATARIRVTKGGASGQPIAGVTIEGAWSGAYGGIVSGTVNENGLVNFNTDWIGGGKTVTFTITKLTIGGKQYDFAGDMSGSIRI